MKKKKLTDIEFAYVETYLRPIAEIAVIVLP